MPRRSSHIALFILSGIDRYTPAMMAAGGLELRGNLKWLKKIGITPCPDCEAGEMHHPDNQAAFVIRPRGSAGRQISFSSVCRRAFGTPEAGPLPTREIALASGRVILTMILSASYGFPAAREGPGLHDRDN